jgi:hypothetical protein
MHTAGRLKGKALQASGSWTGVLMRNFIFDNQGPTLASYLKSLVRETATVYPEAIESGET